MDIPHLKIGIVSDSCLGEALAELLTRVGHTVVAHTRLPREAKPWPEKTRLATPQHTVEPASDPLSDSCAAPCVILAVSSTRLEELAAVVGSSSTTAIVFHTAVDTGCQPLEELRLQGRLVAALTPLVALRDNTQDADQLAHALWAVTTVDVKADAVAHVFVEQLGGQVVALTAAQRPLLAAALIHLVDHQAVVLADGLQLLSEVLDGRDSAARVVRDIATPLSDAVVAQGPRDTVLPAAFGQNPHVVESALQAITDPEVAQAFVHGVRRRASRDHAVDLELWAHNHDGGE